MVADEFIEFVITSNTTAAELASLTFGDSTEATGYFNSAFRFDLTTLNSVLSSAGLGSFLAGTIITVKGVSLGAQNLSYNPTAANVGNADAWSIELVAGLGAKDHPTAPMNGDIDIAGQGDVIWVSTDNPPTSSTDFSSLVSAMGHDNNPGALATAVTSQFGSGAILNSTIGAPKAIYNSGGAIMAAAQTTSSTMSATNGGANSTWIEGLRIAAVVPEPSRAMLLLCGGASLMLRRRRRS